MKREIIYGSLICFLLFFGVFYWRVSVNLIKDELNYQLGTDKFNATKGIYKYADFELIPNEDYFLNLPTQMVFYLNSKTQCIIRLTKEGKLEVEGNMSGGAETFFKDYLQDYVDGYFDKKRKELEN